MCVCVCVRAQWDVATMTNTGQFEGHKGYLHCITTHSHTGIVTGSEDGTVCFLLLASLLELTTMTMTMTMTMMMTCTRTHAKSRFLFKTPKQNSCSEDGAACLFFTRDPRQQKLVYTKLCFFFVHWCRQLKALISRMHGMPPSFQKDAHSMCRIFRHGTRDQDNVRR